MDEIFNQTYLAGRVLKTGDEYTIQFSVLNGNTISLSFDNENDAKIMYNTIESKYLEALTVIQDMFIQSL
ncbi:MAG: hypothetical protein JHC33_09060 [Ignisphaera sp.]|nr:hypothetical protein [Ignisphaera sp.]